MDKKKDNIIAPLYHEQEYPLNLVKDFGHRIDFWEDQTLLIAQKIREFARYPVISGDNHKLQRR